jgi:hypothetical protein
VAQSGAVTVAEPSRVKVRSWVVISLLRLSFLFVFLNFFFFFFFAIFNFSIHFLLFFFAVCDIRQCKSDLGGPSLRAAGGTVCGNQQPQGAGKSLGSFLLCRSLSGFFLGYAERVLERSCAFFGSQNA